MSLCFSFQSINQCDHRSLSPKVHEKLNEKNTPYKTNMFHVSLLNEAENQNESFRKSLRFSVIKSQDHFFFRLSSNEIISVIVFLDTIIPTFLHEKMTFMSF